MNILDQLAGYAKVRVDEAKKNKSLECIRAQALSCEKGNFEFERALKKPGDMAFICECKKASPSKGLIDGDFDYMAISKDYEAAGADCISVLTEPKWFLGNDAYLKEIAGNISVPCIRKDFTVDEYMVYEAKVLGAKAVLLICSILSDEQIREYIDICDILGISALVEAHDDTEILRAIDVGARVIGVNNRNLKDFSVDTGNSLKLRRLIPDDIIYVSESGINSAEDILSLKESGVDAVLVGETLMRSRDKAARLRELKSLIA